MFLRIFDRYLARQIGMATLIGVALLSGVMVLGNVYKKLDELLGNTELPISVVLEFVALVIPLLADLHHPLGLSHRHPARVWSPLGG
jgi:lipopolysaccharide export LptBFGC system permease protein LptF